MLGELISSANSFNVKNQVPTDNNGNPIMAMQFNEFASGGGDIFAGIMINMGEYANIEGMSHELFHGLQHEKGQGGWEPTRILQQPYIGFGINYQTGQPYIPKIKIPGRR